MTTATAVGHDPSDLWRRSTRALAARIWPVPGAVPCSPWLADLLISAVALSASLAVMANGEGRPAPDLATVVLVGSTALPLLAWRRWPATVALATATANLTLAATAQPLALPVGAMTALYLLTSHQRRYQWWRLPAGLALASLLVTAHVVVAVTVAGYGRYDLAHTSIWWAAACFAGERTRLRREQIRELELRAVRERQLAATEERARIARDLHDEAGHAINVIAILAGAARLRHGGDPGRSLAALAEIEDLARTTAEEIDRFVGGLRRYPTDEEPILAPHGVVSIPSLVEHHQHAGLRIRCRTVGVTRPLPPAVDHAAYRIVQEALTNASRYGRGSAELRLDYGEAELELTVTNDVRPGAEPPARGRGHGLIGAGERVGRLGGTLVIERSDHLHVLQARLPYHCGPAACPGS